MVINENIHKIVGGFTQLFLYSEALDYEHIHVAYYYCYYNN
jgi:hypothetical protein